MDHTTDKVSDDSSVSSKSSNSFVEISSDPSESSPELPNFSGYCYPEYWRDPEVDAFYSLFKLSNKELIEKYLQCEKELRTTSLKLQESEKLKEAQKKESDLSSELEIAQRETENERKRVADLETDLSESNSKYDNLKNEFDVNMGASYAHISHLNAMLYHCQMSLSTVIINQQTEITRLLANETFFESMIREMEDHLDNSDAEKLELQEKEFELQCQLNLLKTDLVNRSEHIEELKKDSEMNEQGYEKLKEENLELERKFSALMTDLVNALEKQSETNLLRYDMLMEEYCELREVFEDLRDKVKELENIIEDQRNVILKNDDKSREAI